MSQYKKIDNGIAKDSEGYLVTIEGRYLVHLETPGGRTFSVGMEKDEVTIELMSGEVHELLSNGAENPVPAPEKAQILNKVREGLRVLTLKDVTIP